MRKLFLVLILVFLIGNVFAQTSFPSKGTDAEKEKWIFDSNNKIDLRDSSQKNAIEKYLLGKTELGEDDRGLLEKLVEYQTLDKIDVDLSKGNGISLSKENDNLFLVSSDGQKHDVTGFNALNIQGKKINKISSREDGTIDLSFGEDSIHLQNNTLTTDTFGRLLLSDGTVLGLKDKFGKLEISKDSMKCNSAKCAFSQGFIENELNQNGVFRNLGNNRFSVVDGKTKIGGNELSGNFDFSTDKDRKKIDFTRKINLGEIREGAKDVDSLLQINSDDYGKVEIGSSKGEKVIACFDCADFVKTGEQYDGYVEMKKGSEESFRAEIKGKIQTRFNDDASHNGFDENLLLNYESNSNEAAFRLQSCENCGEGSVASQNLNGRRFQMFNEADEGEQSFSVVQTNAILPREQVFSRTANLIDETGEIKNFYSVSNDGLITIDKVTPQDIEDFKIYSNLDAQRAKKSLIIFDGLLENDKESFATFLKDMRDGADGEIVLAGQQVSIGGKPYGIGNGDYILIRNQNVAKCIDDGRCNLPEIADLGKSNQEVINYERQQTVKKIIEAFVPQSPEQLAFDSVTNLATAGFGKVGAVGFALTHAGSELKAGRTAMRLGSIGTGSTLFAHAGVSPGAVSKFDESLSVLSNLNNPAKFEVPVTQGRQAYLDSLAENLAETTGFSADEIKAVGLGNKFFTGGKGNEPLDVVAFVHTNPATGEVTPLTIGISHFTKEQADHHINALSKLDEALGEGHNYGFKGIVTHDTRNANRETVEAHTVLVGDLPSETQAKVAQAYEDCCSSLKISDEPNGFVGETTSLRTNEVVIGNKPPQRINLPENLKISESALGIRVTDEQTGKIAGSLKYVTDSEDPNHVVDIGVNVAKDYRRNGLQSKMLETLLTKKDSSGNFIFNKVTAQTLIETNEAAFTEAFIKSLESRYKISGYSPKQLSGIQIAECCKEVISNLPKEEFDRLARESLQNTPTYKSFKRFGFEICEQKVAFDAATNALDLGFSVCRT